MSILTRIVAAVAISAVVAGGIYYVQKQPATKGGAPASTVAAPRPVPVIVAAVETAAVPVRLKLVGRAEAFATVTLRARVDGQVVETRYTPGMLVRKGQLMIRLDDSAIRAQLRQAEANLARDRAQLAKARSDLARYTELLAKGYVSPAQLETYRATVDALDATANAGLASVELLRVQLAYTAIHAPMDGVAGAVLVFPGGSVKANDTPLVVLNQVQPLYVSFAVPETQLREVNRDRLVERLRVEARLPGGGSEALAGQLVFVDNAVDSSTGTILMKARFENLQERLTPGQFVEVSMTLRTIEDALVIPSEALQSGPEGSFVYVAKDDRTVEVRKVQVLPADARRLIVQRGLSRGESVVTDGHVRLTPGARYEAKEPAKAPADLPARDSVGQRRGQPAEEPRKGKA